MLREDEYGLRREEHIECRYGLVSLKYWPTFWQGINGRMNRVQSCQNNFDFKMRAEGNCLKCNIEDLRMHLSLLKVFVQIIRYDLYYIGNSIPDW